MWLPPRVVSVLMDPNLASANVRWRRVPSTTGVGCAEMAKVTSACERHRRSRTYTHEKKPTIKISTMSLSTSRTTNTRSENVQNYSVICGVSIGVSFRSFGRMQAGESGEGIAPRPQNAGRPLMRQRLAMATTTKLRELVGPLSRLKAKPVGLFFAWLDIN